MAVLSAGTSDLAVAEEAAVLAELAGAEVREPIQLTTSVTINSFGLVGVTCPSTCPVAYCFCFSFGELFCVVVAKIFFNVLRSYPVATSSW